MPARKSAPPAQESTSTPTAAKPKRQKVDWAAVERDYRTGNFTLRELEAKHGVDNAQIARRKKKEGWTPDLTEAVRQATNARLMTEVVSKEVSTAQQNVSTAVLAVAEVNAQVILGHRTGLQRITRIKETLLDQIEQAAMQMPDLAEVIEMVRNPDENGMDKANDALRKAMSRTALVDDLKKLAEVDEKVRKGEREAFNIAGGEDPDTGATKRKRVLLDFVDVEAKPQ
jgi:hypothetical protein